MMIQENQGLVPLDIFYESNGCLHKRPRPRYIGWNQIPHQLTTSRPTSPWYGKSNITLKLKGGGASEPKPSVEVEDKA